MKTKIYYIALGVIICFLLQTCAIGNYAFNYNLRNTKIIQNFNEKNENVLADDMYDQNQTSNSGIGAAFKNSSYSYAQRFKPNVNVITKISLLFSRTNELNEGAQLEVSLRKYLNNPIKTFIVDTDIIGLNATWVECDFDFVNIIENESYYIVCHLTNASEKKYVQWYFGVNDPYPVGKPYFSDDGREWKEYTYGFEYPDLDFCFQTKGMYNTKPNRPEKPDGPTTGQYGNEYTYYSSTIDVNEDMVYYKWSWGDGQESEWLGPFESNSVCEASHIWMIKGSYLIKVKAKDMFNIESDWSEPLTIKMEKYKIFSYFSLLQSYLNSFI